MLRLVLCVLLAVSALAIDHAPYHGHNKSQLTNHYPKSIYQMDYEDELTIRHTVVQPDPKFLFSFSQAWKDQPLQVEMREESLGRYMYRKHLTTLTTASTTMVTSASSDITTQTEKSHRPEGARDKTPDPVQIEAHRMPQPKEKPVIMAMSTSYNGDKVYGFSWPLSFPDSSRTYPAGLYPPIDTRSPELDRYKNIPQSFDLSRSQYRPTSIWKENESLTAEITPEAQTTSQFMSHESLTAEITPEAQTTSQFMSHEHNDEMTERLSTTTFIEEPATATTDTEPLAVVHSTEVSKHTHSTLDQSSSHHVYRGRHKFKWDDEIKSDAADISPTLPLPTVALGGPTVAPGRLGPPPPVPTLTPWIGDNFRR